MKAVLVAFLVGFAAVGTYASCANSCSGHGRCEANDKCACYANFMGVDCSLRKCPYGTAFADADNAAGVHGYSECSNNGVCDRESGECVCGAGFSGAACDRNTCPNDCSGHGRCTFVEDMTSKQYSDWDKNQARGCKCDPYFTGPDCSLRKCPVGDDVLTTEVECGGVSNGMQVNEVQKITVSADQMLAGEITLGFMDMYGQTWTTRPIPVGGDNKYSIYEVTAANDCVTYKQPSMYSTNNFAVPSGLAYNKHDTSTLVGDISGEGGSISDWTVKSDAISVNTGVQCNALTSANMVTNFKGFTNAYVKSYASTNTNKRIEVEVASYGNNYRHTMGEIGTLAATNAANTVVTSSGDHSTDIANALTELPYNVIPSVTVAKSAVSVDAPDAQGNIYKQEYLVTFDDAANSGDQHMLTCNAASCDEDGCAPRTSGVTHNRIFSATNNLIGSGGSIKSVGKGGFKIKVSNVGSTLLKGAVHAAFTKGDANIQIKDYVGVNALTGKYIKIEDEWLLISSTQSDNTETAGNDYVEYKIDTAGAKGTTATGHAAGKDVLLQHTVPTSFGTWTVCRPFRDGSKSCASFPGSADAIDVQTALRTIDGWEGVTVTLETANTLLWLDQTYVVEYAAGYDDGGVEPTVDAYLIAANNAGIIDNNEDDIKIGDSGIAQVKFSTMISGLDHTDADSLTGHVYVGGSGCDVLFADGSSSDGKKKTGVISLLARSEYPDDGPAVDTYLFDTGAAFHEFTSSSTKICDGNSIIPIAPYISDVKFSNSFYIAKDLNTITLETTFMYNKHSHKAGIFPSTKMAVGDKLTVIESGATDENKVFTVTSFERNTAGVEFAKVWPAPSTASDAGTLRIEGNNGTHFKRSHASIQSYRKEVVKVVVGTGNDGSTDVSTLTQGYWRIAVNGEQTELLNPLATDTDVAAAISKLSGVTGLVEVDLANPAADVTGGSGKDNLYTITFTEMEGDVGHVTATAEPGDGAISDGTHTAFLYVEKVSDAYVLYDPSTADEEADLLADDVAPGTVINVTSSEVVEFIVRGSLGTSGVNADGSQTTFVFSYMGVESSTCVHGTANDCKGEIQALPGLQSAEVTQPATTPTVTDEKFVVQVILPKGVDGSKLTARAIYANAQDDTTLYMYTHRHRNNNGRSFTVLKARENRIGAQAGTSSVVADHDDTSPTLKVNFEEDVYVTGGLETANVVAVHNTRNVRVSEETGGITLTGTLTRPADMGTSTLKRGEVYTVGGTTVKYASILDMDPTDPNGVIALYCLQDCGNTDNHIILQLDCTDAESTDTDIFTFTTAAGKADAILGSSDTFHVIPGNAAATHTGTIAGATLAKFADSHTADTYSNAYVGMGGDELYLDSVPDAIFSNPSSADGIPMDIEYTGPSGSCSVSEVTKGSKESAVCSNRGVCDYETGTCVCAEGFTKEACSEQSVLV